VLSWLPDSPNDRSLEDGEGGAEWKPNQYESEDEELPGIIGGAPKKIAGLSVRTYAPLVEKRLIPPKSLRPEVNRVIAALEQLNFEAAGSDVLSLRRQLQQLDQELFKAYMADRSQRTSALKILRGTLSANKWVRHTQPRN